MKSGWGAWIRTMSNLLQRQVCYHYTTPHITLQLYFTKNCLRLLYSKLMKRAVVFGCILIILASLLYFHTRGIIFHDGGYVLQTAERMVKGEMIYRDFDFVYTPLSVYLTAFLFRFFGQSVLAERIFTMFLSLIGIGSVFYIGCRISRNLFVSFIPVFIFLWWGPAHINFLSPVMLSINLSLLTNALLLRKNFLTAGIVTALVLLSKQNFGIAIIITAFAYVFFLKSQGKKTILLQYLRGIVSVFVIFALYLILTKSLIPFFQNMYFYIFQKILLGNMLHTSLPYGKTFLLTVLKFLIYAFPFIIAVAGIVISHKKSPKFLFLFIFVISFYLFGIRPETDYVHLSPILALTGIPFVIIWKITKNVLRLSVLVASITIMVAGLYTALFNNYYRWEMPLITDIYFMPEKNMRIPLDPKEYQTLNFFKKTVNQYTKTGEYIYINLHAPFLYFYLERKNPSKYYYAWHYATDNIRQKEIINDLIDKKVRLVIADPSYVKSTAPVDNYIRREFKPIKMYDKYAVLLRN